MVARSSRFVDVEELSCCVEGFDPSHKFVPARSLRTIVSLDNATYLCFTLRAVHQANKKLGKLDKLDKLNKLNKLSVASPLRGLINDILDDLYALRVVVESGTSRLR